jgi:ubiquinone/menaquinone biosynthesis C-methylase UbiE
MDAPMLPETYKIRELWRDQTLRRVFLDIISNTQLKKCKQLKPLLIRKISDLVHNNAPDRQIYAELYRFVHSELPREVRCKIQHKSRYRSVNRANKIVEFISCHLYPNDRKTKGLPKIDSVLDLGCGEGSITNVVGRLLGLRRTNIHGCDVLPPNEEEARLFTYRMLAHQDRNRLPYEDKQHQVIYAFMSLHHIAGVERTLAEVYRVLQPGGIFIIREHDCVTDGLALVLDVVHGFYSMVWSNPQEKKDFESEYWAKYRTARELEEVVVGQGFERVLSTHRDEPFPLYSKGKVLNPLKYYYAVYRK